MVVEITTETYDFSNHIPETTYYCVSCQTGPSSQCDMYRHLKTKKHKKLSTVGKSLDEEIKYQKRKEINDRSKQYRQTYYSNNTAKFSCNKCYYTSHSETNLKQHKLNQNH